MLVQIFINNVLKSVTFEHKRNAISLARGTCDVTTTKLDDISIRETVSVLNNIVLRRYIISILSKKWLIGLCKR